ncbi:MAG: winged helix-turn-helix domain-containing protein [Dysgonamonadaceae bacterium]|jgi:hypothetical protein|nr:winged helix-turn-helix domain-containing protein [Dysgonamonadaceae bacterium]
MNNQIIDIAENIKILLFNKGKMNVRQIGEHIHCWDSFIFIAIGWLMKEDQVSVECKNEKLYFILKKNIPEIYY